MLHNRAGNFAKWFY